MVFGSGMLASEFEKYSWSSSCAVLAFGVSNSYEVKACEFQRERFKVDGYLRDDQIDTVVYFSSSNVYQKDLTPYIEHKLAIEEAIKASGKRYHIFRLPQVAGAVVNSTLVSFLVQRIINGDAIKIYRAAERNLIGVDDVAFLVSDIVSRGVGVNTSQDIASSKNISAESIVIEISNILNREAKIEYVDGGQVVNMSSRFIAKHYPDHRMVSDSEYWMGVLRKYVPLVAEKILIKR